MTRVVMLEDYLDYAKQLPSVQALAARTDLRIHTTKASSEADTAARARDADIVVTIRDRVPYSAVTALTDRADAPKCGCWHARKSH